MNPLPKEKAMLKKLGKAIAFVYILVFASLMLIILMTNMLWNSMT